MVEGETPGRKKQYPVKNNKKGVPCMSIQTFTELFVRTEYADSYTWIFDETIPNEEKSRLHVAVD